jgi:mannitol-1-phosphate/altronate dehydrogenase
VPSIVHIGVGGFHRAHQAVYLDDVAQRGLSAGWGIVGVGLHHRQLKDALGVQDCLYTVVEQGVGTERGRVVGSLLQYHYAGEEADRVKAALTDPRTRVVTLTITGNGYHLHSGTGQLDVDSEAIRHDREGRGRFRTAWAYLAEALDRRRRSGVRPFTVLSCDNIADNGAATRAALVAYAGLRNPALAKWIDANVAFPSTMVDRITPKTTPQDCSSIERLFGVDDRSPVVTEPFTQWVVQDEFCYGRPPLEDVGVELVTDVAPHKLVKTRLLNGVHCAIGYLGVLAGFERTAEAMADRFFYRYVEQMMRDEIAPLLPVVPSWNLAQYQRTLLGRLTNPRISDQLSRLAARGSTKMPSYLLPSLHEARAQGRPHALLSLAVAAWLRFLRGSGLDGNAIRIEDSRAQQLTAMAEMGGSDPRPVLQIRDLFGDLGADEQFTRRVQAHLRDFDRLGVREVLRRSVTEPLADVVGR